LLSGYMSASQSRLDVILTSCLIFAWFEFMRNDFDAGVCHLKGGLKILEDSRQPCKKPALMSQHISGSLIYLFARLKIQATVFVSPDSDRVFDRNRETRNVVPTSFSSVEQARNSLDTLLDTVFHFIRDIYSPDLIGSQTKPPSWPDALSLEAVRRSLLDQAHSWEEAVKTSSASIWESLNPRQTTALCLLHIHHKSLEILLETLFTDSQMIYDEYESTFGKILTLAEQFINHSQQMRSIIFFDMGIMAPLYYLILKCRNLALRRKALSLIKRAPCREGIWYRRDVIEYSEWKIRTEERGRGQLSETEALPEEARVSNEQMNEVVINGRKKTVVSFQWRGEHGIEYGEDITDLNTRMGQLV
jgi:hypothetical protein